MERIQALLGLCTILGFAWLISEHRSKIQRSIVLWGLGLQLIIAFLILGIPALHIPGIFQFLFEWLNVAFIKLLSFSDEGARFVFGPLVDEEKIGGFIFGFRVLPTIIFFSALVAVLYYLKILPKIVHSMAWVMKKLMPVGGAESLSTAANVFLGQTEAPLTIKPYLPAMSRSELLCVMIGGMANVAGSVMAAYVAMLHNRFPDIAGHLLTVSLMSAPATILISKMLLPEIKKKMADDLPPESAEKLDANVIEAATRGASEGLYLALNVAAMLIAFIAIVYLMNGMLQVVTGWLGWQITLAEVFGYMFSPVAWLLGVPTGEIFSMGRLLGEKVVLNEFVAYVSLADLSTTLSDRTILIASYALCGFANFSSIGIQVGGIGSMAPTRRADLARLGVKALIGGNLATFSSACLVGILF